MNKWTSPWSAALASSRFGTILARFLATGGSLWLASASAARAATRARKASAGSRENAAQSDRPHRLSRRGALIGSVTLCAPSDGTLSAEMNLRPLFEQFVEEV